jgi:hypothetical protein
VPGKWDSYVYRLSFLDADSRSVSRSTSGQVERKEEQELRSCAGTPYQHKSFSRRFGSPAARPRKINRYTGRCDVCTETVREGEGFLHGHLPVHRECDDMSRSDWEREHQQDLHGATAIGENPEAPLPSLSTRPAQPQARVAKYFEGRWNGALKLHPEWRGENRGIELGPAIGYIQRTFFDAGYNEEHVELMIDCFFEELLNPTCALEIKERQTAWQRFTGWWGYNLVPDPVIERERRAENDRWVALARITARDNEARRQAAWARIEAAEARGENADPKDYWDAEMPVPRLRRVNG